MKIRLALGMALVLAALIADTSRPDSLVGSPASADASFYGRRLVGPDRPSPDLKAALLDLENTLRAMTGQAFTSGSTAGVVGIILKRADDPAAPASARKALAGKGREAVHLEPDGDNRLLIVAHTDAGLCHGIYAYLDQLGCRWFFPSERWQVIPHRDDIRLAGPRTLQPVPGTWPDGWPGTHGRTSGPSSRSS
jgi:hypothetical protein